MTASASLFGLGTSALSAYRSALSVTGNNIAKVGVDGYSRQNSDLIASVSLKTSVGYMGTGVQAADVQRTYDKFLTNQLNTAISSGNHYTRYHEYASIIDEVVADPEIGMTPALMSFFNSVHDVSVAPASIPSRQVMHSEAESLTTRFNTMYRQMQDVREQTKKEFTEIAVEANGLAQSIADLNMRIGRASAKGAPPNDLMDQRDLMVKQLSENFGVTTLQQENMLHVFIGKGQALVVGESYNELSIGAGQYQGSDDLSLLMKQGGLNIDITDSIKGGRAGGILDFTREILNPAQSSLGRIAISLAATFNAEHRTGYGMGGDNDTGNDFFSLGKTSTSSAPHAVTRMDLSSTVLRNASNASTTTPALEIFIPMDTGTTGAAVTMGPVSGLTINGEAVDASVAGVDSATTAAKIAAKINEKTADTGVTARVTSGDQLRLESDENIVVGGTVTNTGLTAGTHRVVKDAVRNLKADDYVVARNGSNYTVTNQTTNVEKTLTSVELTSLMSAGVTGGLVIDGLTMQLSAAMSDGDSFLVRSSRNAAQQVGMELTSSQLASIAASDTADESGNNVNILKMASLQTEKLMMAGTNNVATAGLQDGYGQLVADVGVQTHYADVNRTAQESIRKYAQNARDNASAVNLDEEAANLMKFQQMFQASTRIISIADELFKSVLNSVQ